MTRHFGERARNRCISKTRRDVTLLVPIRRQLLFAELRRDLSDEAFESYFSGLFLDIRTFVQTRFGHLNIDFPKPLWSLKHSDQFLTYVQKIARPGSDGNWEQLLMDSEQRCALLQGIIMKILDKYVFDSLLFGASSKHMEILSTEDVTMINLEGFQRTSLRADTNRAFLQAHGGIPPLFWDEVDKVATLTTHLLIPLYVDIEKAATSINHNPSSIYQEIHNIVAYAGWLNLAVRLSHKITTIEWISPGQPNDDECISLCVDQSMRESINENMRRSIRGRTRVFICAQPKVTRHNPEDDRYFKGRQVYSVMQPHVATYYGLWQDWEDEHIIISLSEHIKNQRKASSYAVFSIFPKAALFTLTIFTFLLLLLLIGTKMEAEVGKGHLYGLRNAALVKLLRTRMLHRVQDGLVARCHTVLEPTARSLSYLLDTCRRGNKWIFGKFLDGLSSQLRQNLMDKQTTGE